MNYEQLIEELREEMLQLVNTKCDALLQMHQSGELRTNMKDTIRESSLITVSPAELKGEKTAGSPVRAGRMDRNTYMEKGGTKDFAGL